ncbi:MAG: hypothetical protein A3K19_17240 [Lentisphaerae bacterium RIFOXYB12_FULL_65_16]|nr:MAG: hypothetical protein A3K18_08785 [Lentisphaerae bacterium RIFOXYA12_64_32]OGV93010.1 MAG: hypothetical protein A3K19_17240 [Lentisphaerae bacterium RIFOXYB12_FULL_65_16]
MNTAAIPRLVAATFAVTAIFSLSTAALAEEGTAAPAKRPIIILKLDDVTTLTPRWQKCAEFLERENVKAAFGIIGNGLDNPKPQLVDWIKKCHDSRLIEFWNHGYRNRTAQDPKGEFEEDDSAVQLASLQKTQALAKEKLGITLHAFGPHWSGTNAATEQALAQVPELTSVFYYTKSSKARPWFVFERVFVLEEPLFKPNFEFVKKKFEQVADKKAYICMQGHANQWDDQRFEQFTMIVKYLKEQGCIFMTPTEYVTSLEKSAK